MPQKINRQDAAAVRIPQFEDDPELENFICSFDFDSIIVSDEELENYIANYRDEYTNVSV